MSVRDLIILGTSSQQPTRKRNQGGYLLRWLEEGLLFDPGEGTQRQFIFAEVSPTVVSRIFISHFHGDHCLGLGSILMRLNLDKVAHPIHCYYPASGKKYFDRLRYGTIYHEMIQVIEHPIQKEGIVHEDEHFTISAYFLDHGVQSAGFRIQEKEKRRFDKQKLASFQIKGALVKRLQEQGDISLEGKKVSLDQVSWIQKGDIFSYLVDTRPCDNALLLAHQADLLLAESTFTEKHKHLAFKYKHMTAKETATLAKQAEVKKLILTHFSARYLEEKWFEKEAREVFANSYAAQDLMRFAFTPSQKI